MKEIQLLRGSDDVIFSKQQLGSVCVALHQVYLSLKKNDYFLLRDRLANEKNIKLTVRTQEIFIKAYFSH